MIRVLFVHEVRLMGDLLEAVLKQESGLELVGYAKSAAEALLKLKSSPCDIVLISTQLANNQAARLTNEVNQLYPATKVIVTELVQSQQAILHCIEAGAAGYVLEEEALNDLVRKIRSVHAGEFALPPQVAAALIARVAELKHTFDQLNGYETDNQQLCTELTAREWDVLRLIEQDYNNLEIAAELTVELGTVKNHVHNIFSKLGVRNRKHAALFIR
ncbi:MAG: response regulator transcription factor, partial [Chloroflexota bacterium]|nr:response regulator transcription factor [Chloroflexota bacterium]